MRGGRLGLIVAATALLGAGFPQQPPDDPLYDASPLPGATNEQWDLSSDRGISVDRAWPLSTGKGVTIAEIDVGINPHQPDLANQWAPGGHDFYAGDDDPTSDTQNAHGTNVAGVLAAQADNGIGVAGIAPGAKVLALRTSDNILHQGARVAEAIRYAADHGATVISMSLGLDSFPRAVRDAVRYANRRGVVMAVASGNEFHFHHHQPQDLPEVLAVGGVNPNTATLGAANPNLQLEATDFTTHAPYADYGAHLDVVAPTQVPTTDWNGYSMTWSGTSAATPHVAGVAALVQARAHALGLTLTAGEVMQIIRQTADDLYQPGWDELSGWGRVDAYRAVARVSPTTIPPEVRIDAPFIYAPSARPFTVRAFVHGRSPTTTRVEIGKGVEPSSWTTLHSNRIDPRRLDAAGYTLRVTATDADGNVGQDRTFFFAEPAHDPMLRAGTPIDLQSSGESSPALADVNGDGRADVVLATSDGTLRVLSGRTLRELKGWPRRVGGKGFLATPAIGNVAGDRRPEIVAAGLDGRLWAFTWRGRRVRGFPYRIALAKPGSDPLTGKLDAAIYASPALADLNGDGRLDIVVGAADQHIYAVDGHGRNLPGWPVLARDTPDGDYAKILSSPAIGDLDGDHHPDVVEGTAEVYGSAPDTTGRVYAFDARGRRLPGWPIKPPAPSADVLPLAGEGVPMSPVLADVDGDGRDEVAIAAFTGAHALYGGDGAKRVDYASATSDGRATLGLGVNAAFGRRDPGGPLELFSGVVDARLAAAQLNPSTGLDFDHYMAGWDAASGQWLPSYPRRSEGWQLAGAPAIADVTGDGRAEVLAGSSGDVLHAVSGDGAEPPGWPKQLGGWLLASPAVGDIDGDGRNEVVAVTRDGYLFVYDTPGRPSAQEWPTFRHDARNTGRYGPPRAG